MSARSDIMDPARLVTASAAIVGALGCGHLLLTYFGPRLLPRDRELIAAMDRVSPVLTRQTTIWRAWIGFNVSHSLGAIFYALVYGYLANAHAELLFGSPYLLAVGGALLATYVVLAWRYWFVTPLVGTAVAFACFAAAVVLA